MLKRPGKHKLALAREVIRQLATEELVGVAAGRGKTIDGNVCNNSGEPDECTVTQVSQLC